MSLVEFVELLVVRFVSLFDVCVLLHECLALCVKLLELALHILVFVAHRWHQVILVVFVLLQ